MGGEKGITVEPYGMDASTALVQRARERLPKWADRIWVGDALSADPPRTFDVVHTLLDFVRPAQHRDLIDNVLRFVRPGGRLVISQYGLTSARSLVEPLGYEIAGETRASMSRGLASIWLLRKSE
jgi:SAM-dependent methyltransferase